MRKVRNLLVDRVGVSWDEIRGGGGVDVKRNSAMYYQILTQSKSSFHQGALLPSLGWYILLPLPTDAPYYEHPTALGQARCA